MAIARIKDKDVQISEFVESLGRLYKHQKIDKKRVDKLLADKKINRQEYDYILMQIIE